MSQNSKSKRLWEYSEPMTHGILTELKSFFWQLLPQYCECFQYVPSWYLRNLVHDFFKQSCVSQARSVRILPLPVDFFDVIWFWLKFSHSLHDSCSALFLFGFFLVQLPHHVPFQVEGRIECFRAFTTQMFVSHPHLFLSYESAKTSSWFHLFLLDFHFVNRGSIVWLLVMDAASRIKLWSKQLKTAEIRRFERPQLVETCLKVPTFDCEKEESKDLLSVVLSPKDWKVLS